MERIQYDFTMAKGSRIRVRIADPLRERLDDVIESTGVSESTIVGRCIKAFRDYVEEHGEVTFPSHREAQEGGGRSAAAETQNRVIVPFALPVHVSIETTY